MSTRLIIAGRLRFANDTARAEARLVRRRKGEVPLDRNGQRLAEPEKINDGELDRDPARGIPAGSKASPFQEGIGYYDRESRIVFRVLSHLDPLAGWAPVDFYMARWGVSFAVVWRLAREGLLDCAMLQSSQVKRFRCRDESAVLRHEAVLRAALERRKERLEREYGPKKINKGWPRKTS